MIKRLFKILLGCLLAVFIWCIVTAVCIWNFADTDQTRQADVAIILGAAVEDNTPTPVFRERIHHGIWLYENGYVPYLMFTGGIGDGDSVSEAYIAKEYAISLGVPEDVIFIEELSLITEENLENAKVIMDQQGFQTALIVSDPLHMKRAMVMAEDYCITAYSSPTPTSMYKSMETKLPFLARETVMYIGYQIVSIFR